MNTTFVTAIYSRLVDGSQSRWERYTYSFKAISNCGANFVVYTSPSEYNDVLNFVKNHISNSDKIKVISHDISDNIWNSKFNELKAGGADHCGRSMDLVHSKMYWLNQVSKQNPFGDSQYFYWIDAGLSFEGLFPKKFLRTRTHTNFEKYTDYDVFNQAWLQNLKNKSNSIFYFVGMSNEVMLWGHPLDEKFYKNREDRGKYHIIGGLFGGEIDFDSFEAEYSQLLAEVLKECRNLPCLPVEELILNILVANNRDKIYLDMFDTWYHEDHEASFNAFKRGKEFYKLFI